MDLGVIFSMAWAALAAVWIVFEFTGIIAKKTRWTFSWHFWWLRYRWWGRALTFPVWHWAAYHFWYEPDALISPVWWDDLALTSILFPISIWLIKPHKRVR